MKILEEKGLSKDSLFLMLKGGTMCTAITYKTKDHYFGRTLDLEYTYEEQVTVLSYQGSPALLSF